MDQELKEYEATVKRAFDLDSTIPFSNGQISHAAIIIAEMLLRSKSRVQILCKELSTEAFDEHRDIIANLKGALQRNVDVSIIVQEKPQGTKFLEYARGYKGDFELPGEISVVQCSSRHKPIRDIPLNFAVMDEKAVRTEENKEEIRATACANDRKSALVMSKNFQIIRSFMDRNGGGMDLLAAPAS